MNYLIKGGVTAHVVGCTLLVSAASANVAASLNENADSISPARKIEHPKNRVESRQRNRVDVVRDDNYRSIDGSNNNRRSPDLGSVHQQLTRLFHSDYGDGISSLAGDDRPGARDISNVIFATPGRISNALGASDFLWQWGQFLDHDLDLTDGADPAEPANISVPDDDEWFLHGSTIPLNRSLYDTSTGIVSPRQQLNEITAWIDASNVYGSDQVRADALRTLDGTGRLKVSAGDLLPFNVDGLPNAGGDSAELFLAGDVRANEQLGLTVMHTLFVREHNRLAQYYANKNPGWSGEQIYQKSRQIVGAQMQVITYREFLPALLGTDRLRRYQGYREDIDPNISNAFSTAAYRFGHSALSETILRINVDGSTSPFGHLPLRDAFFSPWRLAAEGGLEPILRGLAAQQCETIDPYVVDDIRNFLFGDPQAGGFDLVSLNIQRGRDHGLPSYNRARVDMGLPAVTSFAEISTDEEKQARLQAAYGDVDKVDFWVGGLAEDPLPSSHLGLLFSVIIKEQFEALRDGDRFWYGRTLSREEIDQVERTRLSDIIRRNTDIGDEIADNVFFVPGVQVHSPSEEEQEESKHRKKRTFRL